MVYKFLRIIVKWLLKVYFRKIYLTGAENIPKEGPVLITANHPDGFTEPLLLACFLKRPLHFLVRGDLFKNPFLEPVLVSTNQIPIFRSKDGFSNLRNNEKSLEKVVNLLSKGIALLVFAEGSTKLVKRIRPIQKGTAKIAFQTLEQHPGLPLQLVPVSLYYTEQVTFRSEVIISIGEPISINDYFEDENVNTAKNINKIKELTEEKMKTLMPSIGDKLIRKAEKFAPFAYANSSYQVFPVLDNNPLRKKEEDQFLAKVVNNEFSDIPSRKYFYFDAWSIVLIIPAIIGIMANAIPFFLTKYLADHLSNAIVFLNAIRIVVGLILFLFYFFILIVLSIVVGLPWYLLTAISILFGIVFLIYESINYKSYLKITKQVL